MIHWKRLRSQQSQKRPSGKPGITHKIIGLVVLLTDTIEFSPERNNWSLSAMYLRNLLVSKCLEFLRHLQQRRPLRWYRQEQLGVQHGAVQ